MSKQESLTFHYENVKKLFLGTDETFILIDANALMLEIIHNKHMHWNQNRGVYLHFIYGVERFLEMLMGLKKFIKIIFFKQIEDEAWRIDADMFLAYELMLFHLRNVPVFENRLVFCDSLDDYESLIGGERIAAFVGFSYTHLNMTNKSLQDKLEPLLARILTLNVEMGFSTFLTKNLWHDSDAASAFLVESRFYKYKRPTMTRSNEKR
jgi:hypothetical protein